MAPRRIGDGQVAGPKGAAVGTRERIVDAAVATLKERGFAGASARAIARTGGFNQTLIFYHFGSVPDLLLAALDRTSDERMARYRERMGAVSTLPDLVAEAGRIYREDLESGHIKVLAELIAGASSVPELGPAIVARVEPWIEFAGQAIERVVRGSPLEPLVPVGDAAFGIVALYLGVELLTHLVGDTSRADALIEAGRRIVALLAPLLAMPAGGDSA